MLSVRSHDFFFSPSVHVIHGSLYLVQAHLPPEDAAELFYRFAPTLMEHIPCQFVTAIQQIEFLEPVNLIPGFLAYDVTHNEEDGTTEVCVCVCVCVFFNSPIVSSCFLSVIS